MMAKKLTGNYYFNPTMFGLVLMVEHEATADNDGEVNERPNGYKEFQKASLADAFELGLVHSPKLQLSTT